jgi:enoyl-CoA hydratase
MLIERAYDRAMTVSEVFSVERDGGVATLWLDSPERRNAMGPDFWNDLPVLVHELSDDDDVRAIVIAAKGPHFTVGLDLKTMGGVAAGGGGGGTSSPAKRGMRFLKEIDRLQRSITAVADCPKPVIAAIHGYCIGGGVDLITACDIRLASADAKFSVRETKIAIVADVGTLQRLPSIIGKGHVAELAYTGKDIDAERAREIGLVNDVLPDPEGVVKAARELAGEIAANSPIAVQGTKHVLKACENRTVEEGLDYVGVWNAGLMQSNDLTEAMTAFIEKRPPVFKGE